MKNELIIIKRGGQESIEVYPDNASVVYRDYDLAEHLETKHLKKDTFGNYYHEMILRADEVKTKTKVEVKMININRIEITGNVVATVKAGFTKNDKKYANFRIANNVNVGGKKTTTFIDVVAWGKQAEFAEKCLAEGSPVFVAGRIEMQSWETEGQKHSKIVIVADQNRGIQFNGARKVDQAQPLPESPAASNASEEDTEDIPY